METKCQSSMTNYFLLSEIMDIIQGGWGERERERESLCDFGKF